MFFVCFSLFFLCHRAVSGTNGVKLGIRSTLHNLISLVSRVYGPVMI